MPYWLLIHISVNSFICTIETHAHKACPRLLCLLRRLPSGEPGHMCTNRVHTYRRTYSYVDQIEFLIYRFLSKEKQWPLWMSINRLAGYVLIFWERNIRVNSSGTILGNSCIALDWFVSYGLRSQSAPFKFGLVFNWYHLSNQPQKDLLVPSFI